MQYVSFVLWVLHSPIKPSLDRILIYTKLLSMDGSNVYRLLVRINKWCWAVDKIGAHYRPGLQRFERLLLREEVVVVSIADMLG